MNLQTTTILLVLGAVGPVRAAGTAASISLTSSAPISIFARPVTLTATISPPAASGTVTFFDGVSILGSSKITAGQAAVTTISLPAGTHFLKAFYGGDASYAPGSSPAVQQTVNAVPYGGFGAPVSFSTGASPWALASADFNGDGKADLIVADYGSGGNLSVLLGNGDGTFQQASNVSACCGPTFIGVGDFNGDGKPDIAVADYNALVFLGNGDGTFRPGVNFASGMYPQAIIVADFNGDGKADLAITTYDGQVSGSGQIDVLIGNGDGTFQPPLIVAASDQPSSDAAADFNGDGRVDLVITTGNNTGVFLGKGDGTFQAPIYYADRTSNLPSAIVAADFNGDGKPDFAVTHIGSGGEIAVYPGNGDGTFGVPALAYPNSNPSVPYSLAVADFNADGVPDIATGNGDGTASVLLGKGDGTFMVPQNFPLWHAAGGFLERPPDIVISDFNGDGRADVAGIEYGATSVDVILSAVAYPALSVSVADSGDFAMGQTGVYTISVSNSGYAATSGTTTVSDSVPQGFTAVAMNGSGWTCAVSSLLCTRNDALKPASSYPPIMLTVNVATTASGGFLNSATVSGGGQLNGASETTGDYLTIYSQAQISQAWAHTNHPAGLGSTAQLLMTDGSVMVHQDCTQIWYKLTPDAFGNYVTGTWTQTAQLQAGYGPTYFASAVLADGRLAIIGGEYNIGQGGSNTCAPGSEVDTNLGAVFNPAANVWTPLAAPAGWTEVGDAAGAVLPDGKFLLADTDALGTLASLDPQTLKWTALNGSGKQDPNEEEGWTLLPDGTVLTVDVSFLGGSERYQPATDTWTSTGPTATILAAGNEIGPQVLRPDGTVFVAGATGHTGIFHPASGTWTAGPDFPTSGGVALVNNDGPAALLPDGNVLVTAFNNQSRFLFEFDGTRLIPTPVSDPCYSMLPLPTGQVLCGGYSIYTATGSPNPAWAPTITTAPSAVQPGNTYGISGTQFNGLSQANMFGDDYQGATNFPLVRIVNAATGHVFYCRTHNHSTMGVATGTTPTSTEFDVPANIETGSSTLFVVANGIPSKGWNLTVGSVAMAPVITGVEGSGLSSSAVTAISANGFFTIFGTNLAPAGTARSLSQADIVNGALPQNLASTCVWVGPLRAYLTYISPTQINAIAPAIAAVAPAVATSGLVGVTAISGCGTPGQNSSALFETKYANASPEFLYWATNAGGQNPVIAVDAVHGDYIGETGSVSGLALRPARAGDILTLYGIGFGATGSGPSPGVIPTGADTVTAGYTLTIGGMTVPASYVGVTPSVAGLYQVNLTIPVGIPAGNQPVMLTVNGVPTPFGAFLAIGQ